MPTVSSPAVGDQATALWADTVAGVLNTLTPSVNGAILGTWDPTVTVKQSRGYVETTTDGSGNKTLSVPAGAVSIIGVRLDPVYRTAGPPAQALGFVWQLRLDASSLTSLVIQFRASGTGAALTSTSVAFNYVIEYQ